MKIILRPATTGYYIRWQHTSNHQVWVPNTHPLSIRFAVDTFIKKAYPELFPITVELKTLLPDPLTFPYETEDIITLLRLLK